MNPEKFYHVSQTQLSIARHYGGCVYNGDYYLYNPNDDTLTRQEIKPRIKPIGRYRTRQMEKKRNRWDAPTFQNRESFKSDQFSRKYSDSSNQKTWGIPDPHICRDINGIPHWVDRLKCLGNAVVPQVSQKIGEIILKSLDTNK